ncbi:DUF4412 domain-containing protein [Galbibacter sp.]|jgi:hypothetical protein|uniref:DUF4412 domain-containing protein n=1 Tax=Galbibacter sp. TaxID=2918471 RepID=UPI003A9199E9
MKFRNIITVLLILCFAVPAQAQFLKKLKKKAGNAVERTVLNRTDKEVSEATDEAIDGMIESDTNDNKQADQNARDMQESIQSMLGGGNLENVPDQYSFSYKAVMEISSGKDTNVMEYWLEPDVKYFGTKIVQSDTKNFTVLDLENESMTMFMENKGDKMIMPMRTDNKLFKKILAKAEEESKPEDYKFVEIEGKTILGYRCKGYQITTDDGISKVWVTNQTPVGFNSGLFDMEHDNPASAIPMDENSMMMEMHFTPNKKNGDSYSMKCTEFSKENMSIKKGDYTSMLQH